jgi:hypothetical protein
VSFSQIYALMRRHLIALMVLFVLTVSMAWEIKSTPPVYSESANVIFTAPAANPYSSIATFTNDLITTAYVMTQVMLSPESQQAVREAGGTADFSVGLVNFNNLQFPYYGDPYVTITATSRNLADTHRTFVIVAQSFQRIVSEGQIQSGALPPSRISTNVVADTGPVSPPGSQKRALAGLILLATVTAFLVLLFLDRHPIWPSIHRRLTRYSLPSKGSRITMTRTRGVPPANPQPGG